MNNNPRSPFPLRINEELKSFVEMAATKSGRSRNSVLKVCIQIAKENKDDLFRRIGVENAKTAK